ncbi:MAG TPA: tripartite tricarboxylate transporter substrate-binding protein, partial [Kiritimatiellia bacterium]
NPGKLNMASLGVGSIAHLWGELLMYQSGARAVHIPYQGSVAASLALAQGNADFAFEVASSLKPHVDAGKVRLLAVSTAARDAVLPLFKDRELTKEYHALVFGSFPVAITTIDAPVDGYPARTRVRIVARGKKASHLQLRIETGRTHQIRKHLAGQGHPVLGDKVYATGSVESDVIRGIQRQMLHAADLGFKHPTTGKPVQAHARIPADFRKIASSLNLL